MLKEAPEITVMVCVQNYPSAKSLSSERAQAAIFSWMVDVKIRYLGHIVLLVRTWITAPRLLHLEFTILVYCTRVTCFRFFNSICAYLCNMAIFAVLLYAGCDIKIHPQRTSHDKMDQAFCTNIVLQVTNARKAWEQG